jgi:cytolysin-activating lysine-acyltransferase
MDNDKKFLTFGKISWLWSNSNLHRDWSVNQKMIFVLPPIASEQFAIVESDGYPVAYCSWAWFDQETEEKYILNPSVLDPDSWNSGDRLWFIDWISPFSSKYTWALRNELAKKFPNEVARGLRVKKGNKTGKIITFSGVALTKMEGRMKKHQYFKDMVEGLSTNPDLGEGFFLKNLNRIPLSDQDEG